MRILVLNWGVAKEYSWQHTLFEELAHLGCSIEVISARKAWDPRGGKVYPKDEQYEGIRYHRLYSDIPAFKKNLTNDVNFIVSSLGGEFDVVWTFHQANWMAGIEFAAKLKAKHILTCEQAFRTSGYQAGQLTDRWKEIQSTTDLIISWADQDKENESKIGVKYLPFGGCFKDIELKTVGYGIKLQNPYAIYQGSLSSAFKNQDAMFQDISWLLDKTPIERFVINGYPLTEGSKRILDNLQKRWKNRFYYEMLIGRETVLNTLKGALYGYSPMRPAILSNFPYEAFGIGVPMYMPYIKNGADFLMTHPTVLQNTIRNRDKYEAVRTNAMAYYNATHSVEMMGQKYYDAIRSVL